MGFCKTHVGPNGAGRSCTVFTLRNEELARGGPGFTGTRILPLVRSTILTVAHLFLPSAPCLRTALSPASSPYFKQEERGQRNQQSLAVQVSLARTPIRGCFQPCGRLKKVAKREFLTIAGAAASQVKEHRADVEMLVAKEVSFGSVIRNGITLHPCSSLMGFCEGASPSRFSLL